MDILTQLLKQHELQPHPEGGFYRQTWRSETVDSNGRALASGILFLLPSGVRSHWHRTDGEEIWIHQAGAPLSLHIVDEGQVKTYTVGIENEPQVIVPANAWQSAQSDGEWTLVCCIVSPAFEFDTFEMAPPDWDPSSDLNS